MRKALLLLLLVAAPAWSFQPNFMDGMASCTHVAVGFTQLATLAFQSSDSEKPAFDMFVQQLIDEQHSPQARAIVKKMGDAAWKARKSDDIDADAMKLYEMCVSKLGTKT